MGSISAQCDSPHAYSQVRRIVYLWNNPHPKFNLVWKSILNKNWI